jgi:hypothetical protein
VCLPRSCGTRAESSTRRVSGATLASSPSSGNNEYTGYAARQLGAFSVTKTVSKTASKTAVPSPTPNPMASGASLDDSNVGRNAWWTASRAVA